MSKRFLGSIDVDAVAQAVKDKHSALVVTDKGRRFLNIVIWENESPDQYGNTHSVQLQAAKDSQEAKVYIGRAKPPQQAPAAAPAVQADPRDELPF